MEWLVPRCNQVTDLVCQCQCQTCEQVQPVYIQLVTLVKRLDYGTLTGVYTSIHLCVSSNISENCKILVDLSYQKFVFVQLICNQVGTYNSSFRFTNLFCYFSFSIIIKRQTDNFGSIVIIIGQRSDNSRQTQTVGLAILSRIMA